MFVKCFRCRKAYPRYEGPNLMVCPHCGERYEFIIQIRPVSPRPSPASTVRRIPLLPES